MSCLKPRCKRDAPTRTTRTTPFAPDFWRNAWVDPTVYTRFGMRQPPWEGQPNHRLADSGQVLIDRVRHYDVLQWMWLLNSHTEVMYKAMHGDKVSNSDSAERGQWQQNHK